MGHGHCISEPKLNARWVSFLRFDEGHGPFDRVKAFVIGRGARLEAMRIDKAHFFTPFHSSETD